MLDTYTYVADNGDKMDVLFKALSTWRKVMRDVYVHMVLIQDGTRPTLTIYYRR